MSARECVWLVDGYYQIFRAYHSMPDLRAPDGSPVGAFRGYAAQIIRFLARQSPTHVAVCFDDQMTSFRNEIYADYKLGRTEAPEDLAPQFEPCRQVTQALGLRAFSAPSFEADDVIATVTGQLVDQGADVVIVSADKDLGALVCDRVRMFDLKREQYAGPREVEARMGVPPELIPDFLSLCGDSVDNIPGVRGIGAKTAAALLNAFGRIEDIPGDPAQWGDLGLRGVARIAERLAQGQEALALSRELVRLREDVAVRAELESLRWQGGSRALLEGVCAPLGAGSIIDRVPKLVP